MPNGDGSNGDKLVNSISLTLLARISMIIAAGSMPIAGWMIQRTLNALDDNARKLELISLQLHEAGTTIRLVQQNQQQQTTFIADHEARVRRLEGFHRVSPLPPPSPP